MGAAEEQTPSKPSKATSSPQETPPTMASYPDWSSTMQAYYPPGSTLPYYASAVASPTPHPYMWAGQHPMMAHYGTPVHYPAMYPPGGVYSHPNIGTIANSATAAQPEGKNSDLRDQSSTKKSRGSSGAGNEKAETGKATSGSANDGASQSADSGSEGSSDASDDNNQPDHSASKKGSFDLMLEDGANAQHNGSDVVPLGSVPGNPAIIPATNLNIGMDLWNGSAPGAVKLRPTTGASSAVVPAMVMGELCYDERELKKQKRKQSNRESARRSRLRKQAECEELQRKVEGLNSENSALRDELRNLAEECEKLQSENDSIKEELTHGGVSGGMHL